MARKSAKTAEQEEQKKVEKKVDLKPKRGVGRIEAKLNADKAAKEAEQKKKEVREETPVVVQMAQAKDAKSAQMSVKLYPDAYKKFCEINRVRGMSNNSAVNMLISEYIQKNKDLLEQ